jgi:hypothetical protein
MKLPMKGTAKSHLWKKNAISIGKFKLFSDKFSLSKRFSLCTSQSCHKNF